MKIQLYLFGFLPHGNLEELDLRENRLIKIESNSLQHLNKLKIFEISNQIDQIDYNFNTIS